MYEVFRVNGGAAAESRVVEGGFLAGELGLWLVGGCACTELLAGGVVGRSKIG